MTDTPTPLVGAPDTVELEKLLAEATPGPWNVTTPVDDNQEFRIIQHGDYGHSDCGKYMHVSGMVSDKDARLIALAPDLAAEVIALRAEVATLRASEARLREALQKHHQWHLNVGEVLFPAENGQAEPTEIDLTAEYQDSSLCETTCAALQGEPK